jgi:hypothetical protein
LELLEILTRPMPRIALFLASITLAFAVHAQRQLNAPQEQRTTAGVSANAVPSAREERTNASAWMEGMMLDADRENLPYIQEVRALGVNATGLTAHLSETRYVALSSEELVKLPGLGSPGAEPEVRAILGIERKKPMGLVRIYPYRRNAVSGALERLTAYRLDLVEERRSGGGSAKSAVYPDHSKLASGSWYRFSVPQDGVYKLNYPFLQGLGVEMNGLTSERINVYGNHEGLLPYKNSHVPANDLLANAIELVDGGDGEFGPNDYILFYARGAQDWDYSATTGRFFHTKNTRPATSSGWTWKRPSGWRTRP